MREITIDGDKFYLTYPEETMWTESFSRHASEVNGWADSDWTYRRPRKIRHFIRNEKGLYRQYRLEARINTEDPY